MTQNFYFASGFADTEASTGVSWLPFYHDMGLIGALVHPVYMGIEVTFLTPTAFMRKPVRWLQAISKYRATSSGGPNFAYETCIERIKPEQCVGLDLSCWSLAFSGAEPIRARTLERFSERFAAYGFRHEAFYACYGLAEATLMVSGGRRAAAPRVESIAAEALALGIAAPAPQHDTRKACIVVGCGSALFGTRLQIVDPQTRVALPDDEVGEIWVASASVSRGYWGQPERSAETFDAQLASGEGPFLRTGDLGFLRAGELFVTGRLKDLLAVRGRKHYPQDIEATMTAAHPALRPDGGAVFVIETEGVEHLVAVQEIGLSERDDSEAVLTCIRRAVATQHELHVHAVQFVLPRSLPKTTSGKIRRAQCRLAYEHGELRLAYPPRDVSCD